MQKLCTYCQYVGNGENNRLGWFALCFWLFFLIVSVIASLFYPLVLIVVYFLVLLVLYIINKNLSDFGPCPNCKKYYLIDLNSDEAQSIIEELNNDASKTSPINSGIIYKLNRYSYEVPKLCTECFFIGPGKDSKYMRGLIRGLLVIIAAILSIPLAYIHPLALLGSYILLVLGILMVSVTFVDDKTCLNCGKKSLVRLDTNVANVIIEQQKLVRPVTLKPSLPVINDFLNSVFWGFVILISGALYLGLYKYFAHLYGIN